MTTEVIDSVVNPKPRVFDFFKHCITPALDVVATEKYIKLSLLGIDANTC